MPSRVAVDFFWARRPTSKRIGTLRISRAQEALACCAYSLKPSVMPPEDNAGAVPAPDSTRKGGDAKDRLAKHDNYGFFSALGDLPRHRADPHQRQRLPAIVVA